MLKNLLLVFFMLIGLSAISNTSQPNNPVQEYWNILDNKPQFSEALACDLSIAANSFEDSNDTIYIAYVDIPPQLYTFGIPYVERGHYNPEMDNYEWKQIYKGPTKADDTTLTLDNNNKRLYLLYNNYGSPASASVLRYNLMKGNWEDLKFPSISKLGGDQLEPAIASNGNFYVAYRAIDEDGYFHLHISQYRDGNGWIELPELPESVGVSHDAIAMSPNNELYCAFYTDQSGIQCYKYNLAGKQWEDIGSPFGDSKIKQNSNLDYNKPLDITVSNDGILYIAATSPSGLDIVVKKYTDNKWQKVGSPFHEWGAEPNFIQIKIANDNTPYVTNGLINNQPQGVYINTYTEHCDWQDVSPYPSPSSQFYLGCCPSISITDNNIYWSIMDWSNTINPGHATIFKYKDNIPPNN